MRWRQKTLETTNRLLVLLLCGLLLSISSAAQGFFARTSKERNILMDRIDKPQWRIGYNFTAGCPDEFRQKEEELKALITKALQTWIQPLRARYPNKQLTNNFLLVRQPDVEECGKGDQSLLELDTRITFDCTGKGNSSTTITIDKAPDLCIKLEGRDVADPSLFYTLLHELGHAFGLADTHARENLISTGGFLATMGRQPRSIMSGFSRDLGRGLGKDDKNGITWLYKYLHENHRVRNCFFHDYVRVETDGRCSPKYPLIFEVNYGSVETVKQILREDPTLNLTEQDGKGTALHHIVLRGIDEIAVALEMAEVLLLQPDTRVHIRNRNGQRPIQLAQQFKLTPLVELIEAHTPVRKRLWSVEPEKSLTTTWGALKRP